MLRKVRSVLTDAALLRRKSASACLALVTQLERDGSVDPDALERLKRIEALAEIQASFLRRKMLPLSVAALATLFVISVVLSEFRAPSPITTLDLRVNRLEITSMAERNSLQSLLGAAKRVDVPSWASSFIPATCKDTRDLVKTHPAGAMLRLEPAGMSYSIGVGDDAVANSLHWVYEREGEGSVSVSSPDGIVKIPFTGDQFRLTGYVEAKEANNCVFDQARIELETRQLLLQSVGGIGPFDVQELSFDDHSISPDGAEITISTIRSGTIEFQGSGAASTQLRVGDRLQLVPAANGGTTYLKRDGDTLRVLTRGAFKSVRLNGTDVRPSQLELIWSNSSLKILVAAVGAVGALTLSVLRWLGVAA